METCDDEYALTTLRQSKTSQADNPMRPRVSQLLELINDIRDGGFLLHRGATSKAPARFRGEPRELFGFATGEKYVSTARCSSRCGAQAEQGSQC